MKGKEWVLVILFGSVILVPSMGSSKKSEQEFLDMARDRTFDYCRNGETCVDRFLYDDRMRTLKTSKDLQRSPTGEREYCNEEWYTPNLTDDTHVKNGLCELYVRSLALREMREKEIVKYKIYLFSSAGIAFTTTMLPQWVAAEEDRTKATTFVGGLSTAALGINEAFKFKEKAIRIEIAASEVDMALVRLYQEYRAKRNDPNFATWLNTDFKDGLIQAHQKYNDGQKFFE